MAEDSATVLLVLSTITFAFLWHVERRRRKRLAVVRRTLRQARAEIHSLRAQLDRAKENLALERQVAKAAEQGRLHTQSGHDAILRQTILTWPKTAVGEYDGWAFVRHARAVTKQYIRKASPESGEMDSAAAAELLRCLCEAAGFPACTYEMGPTGANQHTHSVTLVEIEWCGRPCWSVHDLFSDCSLAWASGEPCDIRDWFRRLARGTYSGLRWTGPGSAGDANTIWREPLPLPLGQEIERKTGSRNPWFLVLAQGRISGDPRFSALKEAADQAHWQWAEMRSPFCMILSLPKTGSRALEVTIEALPWKGRLSRSHYWARASLRNILEEEPVSPSIRESTEYQTRVARADRFHLRRQSMLRKRGHSIPRAKIISGMREPVGRLLSSMFQSMYDFYGGAAPSTVTEVRAEFIRFWREARELNMQSHVYHRKFRSPEQWFQDEMQGVVGLDVFAEPFDTACGWKVYRAQEVDVFVFRQENLRFALSALSDFLATPIDRFIDANIGADKPYAVLYQACLREIKLPASILDSLYQERYVRHFYTAEECARYRARWEE